VSCRQGFNENNALVAKRKSLYIAIPDSKFCERLPQNTLLDGEIVALDENGRISFNLLQHHRSKAEALLCYVFVLYYRGRSLLKEPLPWNSPGCDRDRDAVALDRKRGFLSERTSQSHWL